MTFLFVGLAGLSITSMVLLLLTMQQDEQTGTTSEQAAIARHFRGRWNHHIMSAKHASTPFDLKVHSSTRFEVRVPGLPPRRRVGTEEFAELQALEDKIATEVPAPSTTALFVNPEVREWARGKTFEVTSAGSLCVQFRRLPTTKEVEDVVCAAQQMSDQEDMVSVLKNGLRNPDNQDAFRALCLEHLVHQKVGDALPLEYLRQPDLPAVRAVAAWALCPADGTNVLVELLRNRKARRDLRTYAMHALAGKTPATLELALQHLSSSADLLLVLRAGAASGSPDTAVAALRASQRTQSAAHSQVMSELKEHVIVYGNSDCEPLLLELLSEAEDPVHVISTLDRVGTIASVEALLVIRDEGDGLLMDTPASQAAAAAIIGIQSRLKGAEAGRLAMAEPAGDAGALSEAPRGTGQVSTVVK
jgi:hypothetical protein